MARESQPLGCAELRASPHRRALHEPTRGMSESAPNSVEKIPARPLSARRPAAAANLKLTVRTQSERFNKVIRRRDERWKEGIYDDDVGGSVLSMQSRIEDSLRNMTDSYAPLALEKRAASARYAKDLFASHVRERGALSDDDRLIISSNYTHTQIYKIKSTPKDRQRRRRAPPQPPFGTAASNLRCEWGRGQWLRCSHPRVGRHGCQITPVFNHVDPAPRRLRCRGVVW